ncbi:MAG: SpoIIE family protein phosphatase [Actinomycetales bacterium]|nr:SpoIIE family protein phosphatase [Actinomycetales bacterium]
MTALVAALLGLEVADLPPIEDVLVLDGDDLAPGRDPHVVVIRARAPHHLVRLQRLHARYPDAAAVAVVGDDEAEVRRTLRATPGLPSDLVVVAPDADLATTVREAAERTARRRRHDALVTAVRLRTAAPPPDARPMTTTLGAALDRAPIGVLLATPTGEAIEWNARAATVLGLTDADLGLPAPRLFALADQVAEAVALAGAEEGFGHSVTTPAARRPEVVVEITAAPNDLPDGGRAVLLLLLDVTGRRAAEAARDALQTRLAVVRRSQEFLLRASEVLAQADDYADTLTQLARVAVPTLGDLCVIDVLEGGRVRRRAAEHADPAKQPLADRLRQFGPTPASSHPVAAVLRDAGARWNAHPTEAELRSFAISEAHFRLVRELDYSGYIAVPLRADGEVLGVLTVVSCGERRFGPDDVMLVEDVAARIAVVVAKARRYDREHAMSVALQQSMLTAVPDLSPWTATARYVPAAGDAQVGGDWYDAFRTPSGRPVLVVGDVVGHDLAAAAAMGQLRSALRALAWSSGVAGPADMLARLEAMATGLAVTDFATVVVALLEEADGAARVRWSSAGHPPPVVVHADGRAHLLQGDNDRVLAVAGTVPRHDHTADLPPGSTLVLYTDGLVERRDRPAAEGIARLVAEAATLAAEPVEAMCDALVARLAPHAEDDVALLAVRVPSR